MSIMIILVNASDSSMGKERCQYRIRPKSERFWEKVQRTESDVCWIWSAATNQRGYGVIGGKEASDRLAHRYSYTLNVGPIPEGMFVCHHCDNPPCVNPSHLFLGTHEQNMADCVSKGRSVCPINGVINRAKTHCINGHPFTPENTYTYLRQRHCRSCARDRTRTRRGGLGIRPTRQQIQLSKTHCPKGHKYTHENTYLVGPKRQWRQCRACHLARKRLPISL